MRFGSEAPKSVPHVITPVEFVSSTDVPEQEGRRVNAKLPLEITKPLAKVDVAEFPKIEVVAVPPINRLSPKIETGYANVDVADVDVAEIVPTVKLPIKSEDVVVPFSSFVLFKSAKLLFIVVREFAIISEL